MRDFRGREYKIAHQGYLVDLYSELSPPKREKVFKLDQLSTANQIWDHIFANKHHVDVAKITSIKSYKISCPDNENQFKCIL